MDGFVASLQKALAAFGDDTAAFVNDLAVCVPLDPEARVRHRAIVERFADSSDDRVTDLVFGIDRLGRHGPADGVAFRSDASRLAVKASRLRYDCRRKSLPLAELTGVPDPSAVLDAALALTERAAGEATPVALLDSTALHDYSLKVSRAMARLGAIYE